MKRGKYKSKPFLNSYCFYLCRFGPYFVAPIVVGLDKVSDTEFKPVIATYDSIGTLQTGQNYETGGTASELIMGCCETFWKPDMGPEELFEVISNSLMSGLDRDSLAGWGAYVYILTPTEIIQRALKTRQD